jgi:hypothetical protein
MRAFLRYARADAATQETADTARRQVEEAERNRPLTDDELAAKREQFQGLRVGLSTGKLLTERAHHSGIQAQEDAAGPHYSLIVGVASLPSITWVFSRASSSPPYSPV